MARKTHEHLDGYVLNEDGDYEYLGKLYRWKGEQERLNYLRRAWVLVALAGASLVAAGCLPSPGGYAFYAIIPYAAAVVVCALSTVCIVRLTTPRKALANPRDIPEHVFEKSGAILGARAAVGAVVCAVASAGSLVHAVLDTSEGLAWRVGFAVICAVASGALWILSRLTKELPLESVS